MNLKRGDVFYHRHWVDGDKRPLRCIVTAVNRGRVYWKQGGERKARMHFDLSQAETYAIKTEGAQ